MASTAPPCTDSTDLMCAARLIALECADENISFTECKIKDQNPASCLIQGEKVTACVFGVLRKLNKKCSESFEKYKMCMEKEYHEFQMCRKEQEALEECWKSLKPNA